MSDKPLAGKVAIVTGAGSTIGLGHAMTLALVSAGARVVMMDINERVLEESVKEAQEIGGTDCVLPVVGDVSRSEDAERTVQRAISEMGGLHVVVNNAGTNVRNLGFIGSQDVPFWELPPEAWFKLAAINYIGPVLMARAAVRHMLDQRWGRIIGVTTSLDTMYLKGNPSYGSTKAGHEAFMASIAQELEGSGVTVNVLVPGGPANTNFFPSDTPLDRKALVQPEVMKAPVVWLASDASNDFHGRRIIGYYWDERLPLEQRLAKAAAPLAWQQLGRQAVRPD